MKEKNQRTNDSQQSKEFPISLIFSLLKPCGKIIPNLFSSKEMNELLTYMTGIDASNVDDSFHSVLFVLSGIEISQQHPELQKEVDEIACGECVTWAKKNNGRVVKVTPVAPENRDEKISDLREALQGFPFGIGGMMVISISIGPRDLSSEEKNN